MATTLCRLVSSVARRTVLYTSIRASSGGPQIEHHKGKTVSESHSMPDTLGHSVGYAREEMLDTLGGLEDPYDLSLKKTSKFDGDLANPIQVTSVSGERMVGCVCEEDSTAIVWMALSSGEPKRCRCGYWFKLIPIEGAGGH